MRASQRLALSVIVIAVAAFLDGGSVTARAMGELPEWQARDAAELHSAPWLICTFGADTAGGIPDSMSWQWRSRKFEHGVDIKKAVSAIIFDDQKRRAGIFNVTRNEDGAVLVEQTVESKEARVRVLQDKLLTVIQVDSHSLAGSLTVGTLAIAYPRTVDGRFTAMFEILPFDIFAATVEETVYVPGACATMVEEPLRQAIEAARAKWLAEPIAKPDVPTEAAPPPMPEDNKAEH